MRRKRLGIIMQRFAVLKDESALSNMRSTPVYVVGPATAAEAAALGFTGGLDSRTPTTNPQKCESRPDA